MFPNANAAQNIIDISLAISVLVFAARVLIKETKTITAEVFQLIEILIRWWIFIRTMVKTVPVAVPRRPVTAA